MVFEVVKFVATMRLRAKRDAGEATPAKDHEKGNRFAGCRRFPFFYCGWRGKKLSLALLFLLNPIQQTRQVRFRNKAAALVQHVEHGLLRIVGRFFFGHAALERDAQNFHQQLVKAMQPLHVKAALKAEHGDGLRDVVLLT